MIPFRLHHAALALLLAAPHPIYAQGCSLCRDNAASTPPATRQAYRRAILLMTLAAGGIFTGGVVLLRRSR